MVSRGAHFDDTSFSRRWTCSGHTKVINVSLNGIVYFLLHQLMHLDVLYEKVLTCSC